MSSTVYSCAPCNSDAAEVIPFDEIVAGSTVRLISIDGLQYLSIRDIIMHVCDKDGDHSGAVWRNLSDSKKSELREFLSNFKFPGRGQQEQPVITFPGAIKLLMFLPGEKAKMHRSTMVTILTRYFAGDPSLLREVEANAVSESPVAQMARASLASETGVQDSLKRKREELELLKLETDIRCQERESQIALAQHYETLCTSSQMDERAKLIFKDSILNSIMPPGQARLTNGDGGNNPLSLSQIATKLGLKCTPEGLRSVGKIASRMYQERHGRAPTKHPQLVDGRVTDVNTYFARDEDLIRDAFDEHTAKPVAASQPPARTPPARTDYRKMKNTK